jgi:hypothetical protein
MKTELSGDAFDRRRRGEPQRFRSDPAGTSIHSALPQRSEASLRFILLPFLNFVDG